MNTKIKEYLNCNKSLSFNELLFSFIDKSGCKDSEIYKQNQEYFDSKKILFENEAGKILAYSGTGWMPGEE